MSGGEASALRREAPADRLGGRGPRERAGAGGRAAGVAGAAGSRAGPRLGVGRGCGMFCLKGEAAARGGELAPPLPAGAFRPAEEGLEN